MKTPTAVIEFPSIVDLSTMGITVEKYHELMDNIKSKIRNSKAKTVNSNEWKQLKPAFDEALLVAIKATSILLRRGEDNDGLDTDEYNLIQGNFNQLGRQNPLVQSSLATARAKWKKEGSDDFEIVYQEEGKKPGKVLYSSLNPKDMEAIKDIPLSPQDTAKLLDDNEGKDADTLTEEQKRVDVTTNDGGLMRWDKENMTVQFYYPDGTKACKIALAPQNTWRRVVVNFFITLFKGIWFGISHPIQAAKNVGNWVSSKVGGLFTSKEKKAVAQSVQQATQSVSNAVNKATTAVNNKAEEVIDKSNNSTDKVNDIASETKVEAKADTGTVTPITDGNNGKTINN